MLITSRRSFLAGLVSALAAPAIVHATNIMPVRNVIILPEPGFDSFDKLMPEGMQYQWMTPLELGYSVTKDEMTSNLYGMRVAGSWRAVPADRFKGKFAISGNAIKVGDCVLVERPKADHVAARNQEIRQANDLVKNWADRCMANGFEGGVRYWVVDEGYRTIFEFGKVA